MFTLQASNVFYVLCHQTDSRWRCWLTILIGYIRVMACNSFSWQLDDFLQLYLSFRLIFSESDLCNLLLVCRFLHEAHCWHTVHSHVTKTEGQNGGKERMYRFYFIYFHQVKCNRRVQSSCSRTQFTPACPVSSQI